MEGSRRRCTQKVCQENWTPPSPWQATLFNRCPWSLCIQHQAWCRVWQHCLEWPQFLRCCTLRAIKQKRCPADHKNKPFIRPISRAPSGSCRFAEPWYSSPYGPMHTDPQSVSRTPSSAPSASPFAVDIAWQAETVTTNKSPLHSCSAPKQILLPTLTALSSSYHLEQICCRYSLQRPPFSTWHCKLFWALTVCTCVFNFSFFLIPEHKCNAVKMFRSIPRFFPILFLSFPTLYNSLLLATGRCRSNK